MGKRDRRRAVPAALIGYFSEDPDLGNLWRSMIAVHRLAPLGKFESAAEDIVFSRWVYRDAIPQIENAGAAGPDDSFSDIEVHALRPVDRLQKSASNDLPADEWVKVAALILSLFLPYPVMETALRDRAEEVDIPRDPRDVAYSRNTQRAVTAVLRARWEFLRTPKDLILNDRAVNAVEFGDWDLWGYFIPLRKDFGVRIAGGPHPKQMTWNGSEWRIAIPVVELSEEQTDNLNRWTWCGAAEVYGPSLEILAEIEEKAPPGMDEIQSFHHIMGAGLPAASDQERLEDQMLLFSARGGIDPADNPDDATTLVV